MTFSRTIWCVCVLAAAASLAPEAGTAQSIRVWAPFDSVAVGERFDVRLALDHDGTRSSVFPDELGPGDAPDDILGRIGDIELIRRKSEGSRLLAGGGRRDSVIYEATTFALDSAYAEPVGRFAFEGDTLTVASAVPITIPVRSVVPSDAEDIRDLAPLADFPRTWWPWLLALALAGGAAYWYLRRRRKLAEAAPEAPAPSEPEESPADEALRRLSELAKQPVAAPDAIKPFFVEVSDITRTYVARRLDIPAREQTTGETVHALRAMHSDRAPSDDTVSRFKEVLEQSDLVKFADFLPQRTAASMAVSATREAITGAESDLRAMRARMKAREEASADGGTQADRGTQADAGDKAGSAAKGAGDAVSSPGDAHDFRTEGRP